MDTLKPELKQGEWSPQFGVYIGTEFSIKTRMGTGRYLDVVGDQVVTKTRSTRKTQKWYFDLSTRTIRNAETKKSLTISDKGTGTEFQVSTTNSEWW